MVLIWLPIPYLCSLFRLFGGIVWEEENPGRAFLRAAELAGKGGSQFTGILLIGLASLMLWINVLAVMIAVPMLFQIFTGEEIALTRASRLLFRGRSLSGRWRPPGASATLCSRHSMR